MEESTNVVDEGLDKNQAVGMESGGCHRLFVRFLPGVSSENFLCVEITSRKYRPWSFLSLGRGLRL